MFWKSLRTALRYFKKRPGFTILNVAGFAIGLASFLLIALYIYDEWSYDRFHENSGRIYRLVQEQRFGEGKKTALIPPPAGPALARDYPKVQAAVRMAKREKTISYGGKKFYDQTVLTADSAFFKVFTFPMTRGNAEEALAEPFSIVLTRPAAERIFGTSNPIGEPLDLQGGKAYTVTGVMEEVPRHSHFTFDAVTSFATIETTSPQFMNWGAHMFWTYLLMEKGADQKQFESKLSSFLERHLGEEGSKYFSYELQPLTDIYLHSDLFGEIGKSGNARLLYVLMTAALLIIILASVNYINLSTAQSSERAVEIGVKKTLGARRLGVASQFLIESILLSLGALVLSAILAIAALPLFRVLTGKFITASHLFEGNVLLGLLTVTLVVGLLSGIYPALVLSGFDPAEVLRGKATLKGGSFLRKGLVLFQFVVTSVLLIATGVTYSQLDYVQEKNLGFDEENVLTLPILDDTEALRRLEAELATLSGVQAVATGSKWGWGRTSGQRAGGSSEEGVTVNFMSIGPNFTEAMNMHLLAGRGFSEKRARDTSSAVLLNQAATRALGWSSVEEAIGGEIERGGKKQWEVIGVVNDFHYASLHNQIAPLMLRYRPGDLSTIYARIKPRGQAGILSSVRKAWNEHLPDRPFTYSYLQNHLSETYGEDRRTGKVFGAFAILAILVASLGLVGLSSHMVRRRTKEIGIRKSLGATSWEIVMLLSKQYVKLVLLAFALSMPIGYYLMKEWLQDFAYHAPIGIGIFIGAGGLTLAVALLAVGYQATIAAMSNPADSLRYE